MLSALLLINRTRLEKKKTTIDSKWNWNWMDFSWMEGWVGRKGTVLNQSKRKGTDEDLDSKEHPQ